MSSTSSVIFANNSSTTKVESWFIPFDILAILCLALPITLAFIFLVIMVLDKKFRTVSMILIANICLTEFVSGSSLLAMNLFTLHNDLQQIQYQDSLCIFRGYLSYASWALHNYSYVLSAFYRCMMSVYSTRLFWQSARAQIWLIILSWIVAFAFPIPLLFTNVIIYNVDNQICQVPFRFSFSIIYITICVFLIPVNLVIFIYIKLVRHVKEVSKRVAPVNTLVRAQNELTMVRRATILVTILFLSGIPYSSFIFLSFANQAPKYHFRIAYVFINFSLAAVMIAVFHFTDSLKTSAKKIICGRPNMVIPTVT